MLFFIRIIANQNTLQMLTGDAASWFMIKKSTLGIDKNTDLGFFGETFVNKVYLATYVCILLFIILSILLYKTRFGLRLRACGEKSPGGGFAGHQRLQDALRGHDHFRRARGHGRLRLCADNGKLRLERRRCGLRLPRVGGYDLRQLEACEYRGLLAAAFGLFKCIAASYASIDINGDGVFMLAEIGISAHLYRMLPYIVTLLVLAFTSKSSRAPRPRVSPTTRASGNVHQKAVWQCHTAFCRLNI